MSIIETSNLSKTFDQKTMVVNNLDLSIQKGEIFGFLGPNGAGKTTTIRMLIGLLAPSKGTGSVLGFNIYQETEKIRQNIGYVAQSFGLYPDLTVEENAHFYATLYRQANNKIEISQRIKKLFQTYGFTDKKKTLVQNLSGGWKQRLSLICAITHQPQLLFLDEPTAGVDPVTRRELWDLFYELAATGITLFITTHYMEEAERCHSLGFIMDGKLMACDKPNNLKTKLKDHQILDLKSSDNIKLEKYLKQAHPDSHIFQFGNHIRIITKKSKTDFLKSITKNKDLTPLEEAITSKPTIEDVFFVLTKKKEDSTSSPNPFSYS